MKEVKKRERKVPYRRIGKGLGYYDFFDEKLAPKNTIQVKMRKEKQNKDVGWQNGWYDGWTIWSNRTLGEYQRRIDRAHTGGRIMI